ncbi:MAG: hypothetical protein Q8T08_16290, partial [Ignavibacteria bacterium]|nr:hypothetical protein [Ignavibacteria bacterium]
MKKYSAVIVCVILPLLLGMILFSSCDRPIVLSEIEAGSTDTSNLEDVLRLGKLKVLTDYNSVNY